jgi:lysophospholipase L1-like esterase
LEALIASHVNPYPEDGDIHPVEAGYDAIARAVVKRLERDGIGR